MVANDIKISRKMKNEGWLSIDKKYYNVIKYRKIKMPYKYILTIILACNHKKDFLVKNNIYFNIL